jgi:hypothetical protein
MSRTYVYNRTLYYLNNKIKGKTKHTTLWEQLKIQISKS